MKRFILLLALLQFLFHGEMEGQVRLPSIFSDHMVLQRNEPIRIWGWASAGEKVSIHFMGKRYAARAGNESTWEILLPPMEAGGPYLMEITASNHIEIRDILVGEVWLCSGQSNMVHYFARHQDRYAREIAESENSKIRQFLIPATANLLGPAEDIRDAEWKSADPENLMEFSVVGYFFALSLFAWSVQPER